jgi:hypothetical protein
MLEESTTGMSTHNEAIRREFEKQAESFSNPRFTYQLDWMIGEPGSQPGDKAD